MDLLGILKAPRSIKLLAPPALILTIGIAIYSYVGSLPMWNLITVGLLAGLLGTVALDSVRIPGYLLGYMPMDLPVRFGTKALGIDGKFMFSMMPKVMTYVNKQMAQGVSPATLLNKKGFPSLPVTVIRDFARPTLKELLQENKTPLRKVRLAGYAWHYSNGASFGIAHAVLFGRGSWPLTVGFGLTLAIVFLLIIQFLVPPMRLGIKLPVVVLLAHVGVILVIGLVTQSLVSSAGDSEGLIHQLQTGLHP